MAFISLSAFPSSAKTAVRSVGEGAVAAAAAAAGACALWCGPGEPGAIALGAGTAWLASSASVVWLILAREDSTKAFWRAFGGGLALRLLVLAGLMAYSVRNSRLSGPALLLSYAFGVLCFLMIEYRHIKAK